MTVLGTIRKGAKMAKEAAQLPLAGFSLVASGVSALASSGWL